jgi:hypothetical protein
VTNYVGSAELKVTYKEILDLGIETAGDKVPFNTVLWYPSVIFTKNKVLYNILAFLFQWIPAYFLDFVFYCLGYPTG